MQEVIKKSTLEAFFIVLVPFISNERIAKTFTHMNYFKLMIRTLKIFPVRGSPCPFSLFSTQGSNGWFTFQAFSSYIRHLFYTCRYCDVLYAALVLLFSTNSRTCRNNYADTKKQCQCMHKKYVILKILSLGHFRQEQTNIQNKYL